MQTTAVVNLKGKYLPFLLGLLVLVISYFTYFRNYQHPPNLFWDENYHIASAQKYLNGIFFMSDHPPLGKMFIALGEFIVHPNNAIDREPFVTTDYIKDIPAGYSFAGVRFFPSLFAMLSAVLFFVILYKLSGRSFLSFLFTSLYLFENSLVVHSRGAMLESTQIFFVMLFILYFILCINKLHKKDGQGRSLHLRHYAKFGLLYGLVVAVKLNGIPLGLLLMSLLFYDMANHTFNRNKQYVVRVLLLLMKKIMVFVCGASVIFVGVYYVHFVLSRTILDHNTYQASQQYLQILKDGKTADISSLPLQFYEHIAYVPFYEKGVPKYDACKPGENGSLPVAWPFGNKSINYRWESKDNAVRYLYLQGNPLIWLLGLTGIFIAVNMVVSRLLFKTNFKDKRIAYLITTFLSAYLLYMSMMMSLERVMYLYHYFLPLIISQFLFFLVFTGLFEKHLEAKNKRIYAFAILLTGLIITVFIFFSPLTYYEPLTHVQFQLRNWFPFWGLTPIQ